jgi:hypothetical protein
MSNKSLIEFKHWLSESTPGVLKNAFKELKAGNNDSVIGVNKFMSSFKSSLLKLTKHLAAKQWTKGWTHGVLVCLIFLQLHLDFVEEKSHRRYFSGWTWSFAV